MIVAEGVYIGSGVVLLVLFIIIVFWILPRY